jgi:hypothetical protein
MVSVKIHKPEGRVEISCLITRGRWLGRGFAGGAED